MNSKLKGIRSVSIGLLLSMAACRVSSQSDAGAGRMAVALKEQDANGVAACMNKSNVNTSTPDGMTPLMVIAEHGTLHQLRGCLDLGAAVDAADQHHNTALTYTVFGDGDRAPFATELIRRRAHVPSDFMLAACRNNRVWAIRLLLNRGADVNVTSDGDDRPPLIWSAELENVEAVSLLLKHGAEFRHRDGSGRTAWDHAVGKRLSDKMAAAFVDAGQSVDAVDLSGETALLRVARFGNVAVCRLLLDRGASVEAAAQDGKTVLMRAAMGGSAELVALLISRGARVPDHDSSGQTALHYASEVNRLNAAKILVEHGADVNSGDSRGTTPLALAAGAGSEALVRYLLANGAHVNVRGAVGGSPLTHAALAGSANCVKLLLSHGADVSEGRADGGTAVLAAAASGDAQTVQLLLDAGGDFQHNGDGGGEALRRALELRVFEFQVLKPNPWGVGGTVALLVSKGARFSGKSGELSPLLWSIRQIVASHMDLLEFVSTAYDALIGSGENVDDVDSEGNSGLIIAAKGMQPKLISYLLGKGSAVNLRNRAGETALAAVMSADAGPQPESLKRRRDCVQILLENRADPFAKNTAGRSAFSLAQASGDPMLVKLFVTHGAK